MQDKCLALPLTFQKSEVALVPDTIIAKIAVADATFTIDKPYDYIIPEPLTDAAAQGMRVSIPFGRGNRRSEGVILSIG